jgi:hypothetical protein
MAYRPKRQELETPELPEELAPLLETIAERVHDTWAALRFDGGWTFGPQRDDHKKQHPSLIAFAELPEDEKEIDRRTAETALRAVIAAGWSLVPPRETWT